MEKANGFRRHPPRSLLPGSSGTPTSSRAAPFDGMPAALLIALLAVGCAAAPGETAPAAQPSTGAGSDALLRLPRADSATGEPGAEDHAPAPAPRPPQQEDGSDLAASPYFAWRCEDGARPETRWDADSGDLLLRLGGERLRLRPVRVASGAAWEDGGEGASGEGGTLRFWNRGEEAMLTAPGRDTLCRVDPVTTADLRAAAQGALFRALGNEPGWSLVIRPDRIDWVTDYGTTRASFGNPEMRERGELEVWEAGSGESGLRVEIGPGPCLDASERSFPATVTVLEGERRLPGCGSRLQRPFDR